MTAKALKLVGVNILVFLGLLLVIEATGRMMALIWPSYDVLFLEPDQGLGWKPIPNFRFTWAGGHWYAAEFSVDVEINPVGFRDVAREFSKPEGVTRVAVLGDSFIEAVQVPLPKTATQLLERRLNALPDRGSERSRRWEVLNFGISNHGVGQYLLMWEQHARRYDPDYVVIFVAKFHMGRTIAPYSYPAFPATRKERLWVRPTFRLQDGSLIREPARDFDKFVKAQHDLIETEFAGKRIRKKKMQLLTPYYARRLWDELSKRFKRTSDQVAPPPSLHPDGDDALFALNLKIIEELGLDVRRAGGRLVVVDASQYFQNDQNVPRVLTELCAKHGFGYVAVYKDLSKAHMNGKTTRWKHDTHFNETGNMILAASLHDWIAQTVNAGKSR